MLFALSSCTQLLNGEIQPVIKKNNNVYYTTCSGAVENMANCNKKAMDTCPNGYNVLDKFQDTQGAVRSLTFGCRN